MTTAEIVALVAGLVIAIPAFWCAVVFALAIFGGWRTLAASYATHESPHGRRFAGESGSVGGVSYRNSLTVYVAPEGLFLTVPLFLRFGHAPLLIPWSAITNQRRVKFLWRETTTFQAGSAPATQVSLSPAIFAARNVGAAEA